MTRDVVAQLVAARTTYKLRRNSYPNGPLYNDGDWEGGCAAFRYVDGGYPGWYGSAWLAYQAAKRVGKLDLNPATARPGEEHYWSGVKVRGVEQGHVAAETGGNILLMASSGVTENFGHNSGLVSKATYERAHPWLTYLGHAPRFGRWPSVITSTAGLGSEPLDNTTPAPIRRNTVSTIYYWTTTDKPSTSASPQKIGGFALAGDGQGEAAWLPINAAVYEEMTPVHGQGVFLSKQSFDAFQKMYTAGASAPVAGAVDLGPLLAKLDALTAAVLAPETTTKAK